ncbi:MAG: helix-turn-helix domain-containing protein, partial [Nocardioidaceae bacterium]
MRYEMLRESLRRARLSMALTQEALAARSGTSRVTIARLEAGSAQDVR